MTRVIVHHAHYPDEGDDGVYRLVHAEQEEVTHYDLVGREPEKKTITVLNPDYVPVSTDEEDDRTDEQKEVVIEQEIEVPVDPEVVERTEVIEYDHREIIWAADDPRWKGKSPEQIAELQLADVREALTKADEEVEASARRASSAKDLGSAGTTL
jgi:hypothetical protein